MSVLETLSGLAVRHLPRKQLLTLRERYLGMRRKLFPLMRLAYGTFDAAQLRQHLEERVGHDYEILMVHSSLNHMLPMYTGNAGQLLQMLVDFCGPDRTLAMPAFYFGDPELNDVVESYRRNPVFDLRRTPSQMGILTELFRRSPGVRQSLHPTHRVAARGPLADALTRGHESAGSIFGLGTPFDFMAKHETCVIGIGKPFEVLTQAHTVEDLLGEAFPVPHRMSSVTVTLRRAPDDEQPFELRWRKFDRERNMWKLRDIMDKSLLREWEFHHVPLFATRAREVTESLVSAARNGKTLYVDKQHAA
jgi:aminoglycoside N3'-acetyltransferase